ncbi:MAG TPA: CHASE2 domain-containing protein, partial [Treponemataceae bacterium]|nr:CHASE2 domain-containing protein [Treponemataceae bacterium]
MKKKPVYLDILKKKLEYITAFACLVLLIVLSLSKAGSVFELGLYDVLLDIKPEIEQRPEILLVDIDDYAIEQIGAFPWTRDIIADALIRLREVGGSKIVFD